MDSERGQIYCGLPRHSLMFLQFSNQFLRAEPRGVEPSVEFETSPLRGAKSPDPSERHESAADPASLPHYHLRSSWQIL